jgi:hypothetical protein
MRRDKRGTAVLGTVLMLLGGLVSGPGTATAWAAPPWCPQTWRLGEVSERSGNDFLSDLVATGPASAWAVGATVTGGSDRPLVRHWNGAEWTDVSTPDLPDTSLGTVDASSDQNVWAFGGQWTENGRRGKALHWNGTVWTASDVGSNFSVTDADVVGTGDVWIAGRGLEGETPLRHWNGRSWAEVAAPGEVWSLHMTSGTQGWAVGMNDLRGSVLRWDGSTWRSVPIPAHTVPEGGTFGLASVLALSPTNVWAVGAIVWPVENREESEPVALRWDGTRWTKVDVPGTGFGLGGLAPDGCGGVWMRTYQGGELLHYRAGRWTKAELPNVAETDLVGAQLANVPGTAKMLGVGVVSRWNPPSYADQLDGVHYQARIGPG